MTWRSLACFSGFVAATLLLTWPLASEFARAVPTVVGLPDALLQAFLLDWDLRALASQHLHVFDVPIFHPERNTLTYMDHLLGEAVVAAPWAALTRNAAVAYNSVVAFSFLASALATYRLARWVGISRGGSFLCGLFFAFSPYRYCNMANLNLLQTEFLPLGILFALRFTSTRRSRDLWATGLTFAAQSYFSWYYTFYLATALVVVFVVQLVAGNLRMRDLLEKRIAMVGIVTVALLLPGLAPYLRQRSMMQDFERTIGMTSYWSADLLDYLRTNVENRSFGRVPLLRGDQPYGPGLVVAVLAWLGLRARLGGEAGALRIAAAPAGSGAAVRMLRGARNLARRLGDAGTFLSLAVVGFVLSLGPVLKVAGHILWIPLPYAALFYVVPGFSSMRASGRFAVLVLLGTVLLAGFGYEWCRRHYAPRGARALTLFAGVLLLSIVGSISTPWPMVAFPQHDEIPPIYAWLEGQPGAPPVLDLPVPVREADEGQREATRQIYAIYHKKPLVDGMSGFVPPGHREFRVLMQRFPEPEAIRAAAARGTRIAIVHFDDWGPVAGSRLRAEADRSPGLKKLAEFGTDVAYEVTATR